MTHRKPQRSSRKAFASLAVAPSRLAMLVGAALLVVPVDLGAQQPPQPRPLHETAAQGTPPPSEQDANVRLDEAPPVSDVSGPYLAARQAGIDANFPAAVHYYTRAVDQDPHNAMLLDNLLYALVSSGDLDGALQQAERMQARGDQTDMMRLVLLAGFARDEDWPALLDMVGDTPDDSADGVMLLDGMLRAWALLGEGRASDANAQFEELSHTRGAQGLVDYNLAMAKAMVGDFEGALARLEKAGAVQHLLATLAKAEILAQLDRRDDAIVVLDAQPGGRDEPAITELRALIESGAPVPFTAMTSAREGIAQLYLTFASVLGTIADPDPLSLVHAQLAVWVQPDLGEARLVLAQILQEAEQFDMAAEQYDALAQLGEVRPVAELARIDALLQAGRAEQALTAANALTQSHPDLAQAWIAQGDVLRQSGDFAPAADAYTAALDLLSDAEDRWFPLYARGISRERSGQFDLAEPDFRAALEISPDHPQILNYLGYSLIDRGEKLDEALAMIERAVELRPDGYILDSLAWGYHRVGRHDEAVAPMEEAVALMAEDPLVNDHLGDIYWMVGRHREARIQWRRALSLLTPDTPSGEEVDPERIHAKLERGLEAVLEDEAAGRPLFPDAADDRDKDSAD